MSFSPDPESFSFTDIEKAIGWYLEPQRYENDKRFFYGGQSYPILTDILEGSRSALPAGVESGILRFLDEIKEGRLQVGRIPMRLAERILPIAQRLERQEAAARGEKFALAAMARKGEVGEGKAEAGAEAAEVDLTPDEKVFMDTLEGLVGMEKSTGTFEAKGLQQFEARELRQYFQDMRLYFSRLPSSGQLRTEVMKSVFGQFGAEAERLRKSGKPEAEIFDEWLKQVFIPLYRRTNKKP